MLTQQHLLWNMSIAAKQPLDRRGQFCNVDAQFFVLDIEAGQNGFDVQSCDPSEPYDMNPLTAGLAYQ